MKIKSISLKKILLFVAICVVLYGLYTAYELLMPNTRSESESEYLLIPTGSSLVKVFSILEKNDYLENLSSFKTMARRMGYNDKTVKPGRYKITQGMSNFNLIKLLKSGRQTPVKFVLNSERKIENLAGHLGDNFESDSLKFLEILNSKQTLDLCDCKKEALIGMFIPNTYEVYWNAKPIEIIKKLFAEEKRFWEAKNRLEKAQNLGLSKNEVMTLASIVEKETTYNPEKPRIAGLYFNRLTRDMKLQSDPTVVYAVGDFSLRRILHGHLTVTSPYNTYMNLGLPPGPICIPSISSIDAVLSMERNNFLYMCAKPNSEGSHSFATSYSEHLKFASEYRQWLDSRGS